MKTNTDLVNYAKSKLGCPYWYGTFGQIATSALYDAKRRQYKEYYTASDFLRQLGQQVFDCIGLIKAYLWTKGITDTRPVYNASEDWGADETYRRCTEKGAISTLPELPGVLVFLPGHVGVYIGGGEVIEARGHAHGVVKTRLKDRPWRTWGKHPLIKYIDAPAAAPAASTDKNTVKELYNVETIRQGARGYGVQAFQAILVRKGYDTGGIDGIFGGKTYNAVVAYQRAKGLAADGIIGAQTSAALCRE